MWFLCLSQRKRIVGQSDPSTEQKPLVFPNFCVTNLRCDRLHRCRQSPMDNNSSGARVSIPSAATEEVAYNPYSIQTRSKRERIEGQSNPGTEPVKLERNRAVGTDTKNPEIFWRLPLSCAKLGTVCFSKSKGYAPWPAKIIGIQKSNKPYKVCFFGTNDFRQVTLRDLFLYCEQTVTIFSSKKRRSPKLFQKGIVECKKHFLKLWYMLVIEYFALYVMY